MKTEYPYGSRTPLERLRYPQAHPRNQMWACDNPQCPKVHHYASHCVNAEKSKPRFTVTVDFDPLIAAVEKLAKSLQEYLLAVGEIRRLKK